MANSNRGGEQHVMQQNQKLEVPQLWVKDSLPLNVREIANVISYKLIKFFKQKVGVLNKTRDSNICYLSDISDLQTFYFFLEYQVMLRDTN